MARSESLLLKELRGAIGKQLVIKQYASGTVVSKYPDMSRVKPSRKQKIARGKFAKAVKYAKSVVRDPARKEENAKKRKKGERPYQAAIKEYLKKHKD